MSGIGSTTDEVTNIIDNVIGSDDETNNQDNNSTTQNNNENTGTITNVEDLFN